MPLLLPTNKRLLAILGVAIVVCIAAALWLTSRAQPHAVEPVDVIEAPAVTVQSPPVATTPANDKATQILELFNPSDQSVSDQLSETTVSQQIEQVLTVSFVLTRCHIITEGDYKNSFRALIVFAQKTKLSPDATSAEARVRKIAEAAGASYALIYSRAKCNDPSLSINAQQLLAWQHSMLGDH